VLRKTIGYVKLDPSKAERAWKDMQGVSNYDLFGDLSVIEVVVESSLRCLLKKHPHFWDAKYNKAAGRSIKQKDGSTIHPYLWMDKSCLIQVDNIAGPNKEKKSFLQKMED